MSVFEMPGQKPEIRGGEEHPLALANKPLIEQLTAIKLELRKLEEEEKALTDKILGLMDKSGVDQMRGDWGTLSVCEKKTWKYSDEVTILAEELKMVKEVEERTKKASVDKIVKYLRFTIKD